MAANNLSDGQITKLKAEFRVYEENDSGSILVKNLAEILISLEKPPASDEDLKNLGEPIDFPAFLEFMKNRMGNESADINEEDEWVKIKEAFQYYDTDGNAKIPSDKVKDVMISLGRKPPTEEELELMDPKRSRKIAYETFVVFMKVRLAADETDEDMLIDAFRSLDRRQDGFLSADEIIEMLPMYCGLTIEEIKEMIKFAEVNGDGDIDYVHFVKNIMSK